MAPDCELNIVYCFSSGHKTSRTGKQSLRINASSNLVTYDFTDFLLEARWNGLVVLYPRDMRNCQYVDWGKEVGPKTALFRIFLSKSGVLLSNKIN